MYHWVSSDYQLSCLWLLIRSQAISYLVFLFSCCLLIFPTLLSFTKNTAFSWSAGSSPAWVSSFFVISDVSVLICSMIQLFVFLLTQGILRDLLQHRISDESFFFPISLLHCPTFTYIRSNCENEGINGLSLGF